MNPNPATWTGPLPPAFLERLAWLSLDMSKPIGVLTLPTEVTAAQARSIKDQVLSSWPGPSPIILGGGMTYQPLEAKPARGPDPQGGQTAHPPLWTIALAIAATITCAIALGLTLT